MKILVAIDSFKGSASSDEANQAVKKGILSAYPEAEVVTFPIADGGEGTLAALESALKGQRIELETFDLLERPIKASYLLANQIAVIEVAEVVGLDKIEASIETVQKATTAGLAKVLLGTINQGAKEIYFTLGGTGTSDGGRGLLNELRKTNDFENLFKNVKITGLTDVTNPYYGPKGFAYVFGPQKGASPEIVQEQDEAAKAFAEQILAERGIDLQTIPGTGAAGGLGAAIVLLGGELKMGFPEIARLIHLEAALKYSDLVITGEGRMDAQTEDGKVPQGMATLAQKYGIPCIAVCGSLSDQLGKMENLLLASYSIQRKPISLAEAMDRENTLQNLELLAKNIVKTYFH